MSKHPCFGRGAYFQRKHNATRSSRDLLNGADVNAMFAFESNCYHLGVRFALTRWM